MSKRIVVGLDPSEYSESAQSMACARAKLFGGTVIGVGVVDVPGIERSEKGAGVGAGHYAKKARAHKVCEAKDAVADLVAAFEDRCRAHGVAFEIEVLSGDPADMLRDVAASADLLCIGSRTYFCFETQDEPGDTLAKLLRSYVCPIFVAPKKLVMPPEKVVIAYDSSPACARAMRTFVHLTAPHPLGRRVTLLRVEDDLNAGAAALERPRQYLEAYGYEVETEVVPGDPPETVLAIAKAAPSALVVLGASGKGAVRQLFYGSVTKSLLEDGTVPFAVSA
jgi:nucleotide-binding universal stress UspA family protein